MNGTAVLCKPFGVVELLVSLLKKSIRNKICGWTVDSGNPRWRLVARLNGDLKAVVACFHKFRVILVPEPWCEIEKKFSGDPVFSFSKLCNFGLLYENWKAQAFKMLLNKICKAFQLWVRDGTSFTYLRSKVIRTKEQIVYTGQKCANMPVSLKRNKFLELPHGAESVNIHKFVRGWWRGAGASKAKRNNLWRLFMASPLLSLCGNN